MTDHQISEAARSVDVVARADVVVCGGGPAGAIAAIAAARAGADTVLIEQAGCLGGVWTSGLLSAVIDAEKPDSILAELVDELRARGAFAPRTRSMFLFVPEQMKLLLEQMAVDAGVRVRLGTRVVAAAVDGSRLRHVVTESKSGREAWSAEVFIDCTGDGDLAARAGCAFDYGNADGVGQPLSLLGLVSGPDPHEAREFWHHEVADRKARLRKELVRAGIEPTYGDPTLFHIGSSFYVLMANHQYGVRADDADALTRATLEARTEVHRSVDALRGLGGIWANLTLVSTADQIGVREGRRVHGRTTLTADDLANGTRHADAVASATFGMDVHSPDPGFSASYDRRGRRPVLPYDIPYGALVARDVEGLLLAGRCISGDFHAHASYRVTGNAAAMGEAAGRAAAECVATGAAPHELRWRSSHPASHPDLQRSTS